MKTEQLPAWRPNSTHGRTKNAVHRGGYYSAFRSCSCSGDRCDQFLPCRHHAPPGYRHPIKTLQAPLRRSTVASPPWDPRSHFGSYSHHHPAVLSLSKTKSSSVPAIVMPAASSDGSRPPSRSSPCDRAPIVPPRPPPPAADRNPLRMSRAIPETPAPPAASCRSKPRSCEGRFVAGLSRG